MSWKQLLVNEKQRFEQWNSFQLNPSIPYIVLVDNNMKVLKSQSRFWWLKLKWKNS
jgi:hypothetical protein